MIEIRPIKTCTEPCAAAHRLALESGEPLFVPITPFADDRGWSFMNQLTGVLAPEGQINISWQHPGVIKAWHRHQLQTDFWICIRGHIKVGVYKDDAATAWMKIIGDQSPGMVIIPPPLWHGAATVGAEPAGLLYYVTKSYNARQPDEERRPHDSVNGFPWSVRHG